MRRGPRLARPETKAPSAGASGPGMSPGDIADHNSRVVLSLLRTFGPLTRQELSARLGLTEPAVTGIMSRLDAQGLVLKRKRASSARYHAAEFALRPGGALGLGISLSADKLDMALIDLYGTVVAEQELSGADLEACLPDALSSLLDASDHRVPLGVGIAVAPGCAPQSDSIRHLLTGRTTFVMPDTEACLTGERLLGLGEPEGGLVVVLIDDTVRAGLFIGGKTFRGMSGRAGQIGEMRPGRLHPSLTDVANRSAYLRALEAGPSAVAAWTETAASRLLDAVVAIAGFVSPGALLLGGALPEPVLDSLIDRMQEHRNEQASTFVAAPWIPPIRRVTLGGRGAVIGAAMTPMMELLLPRAG
ncbi:MarR family transcriptional regulator [Rhizobium sp. DKSPLA3]|uniref:MarR family transcriptional regulator n=1 Tax=Rhizobium quercicola TaxID=2901226 RepID=A0A9X1SYP5_9HYPH|nr:ROK family transcriptional regulator [Rhizobium quercicola]MCD7107577.1 MarR family transcriptional regulator [Rhizobium quercicola]